MTDDVKTKPKTKKLPSITPKRRKDIKTIEDNLDKPIDSNQWRNILFSRFDTKSYRDQDIHPTEEAAKAAFEDFINRAEQLNEQYGHAVIVTLDGPLMFHNWSHTIQMPLGGAA